MAKPPQANAKPQSLRTILLVDDQDDLRIITKSFLSLFGYAVDSARNPEQALTLFDPKLHDVVITDNGMPGMSGAEMAHIIKLRSPLTPVVMFTAHPPPEHRCLDAVLQKPGHLTALKAIVDKLLRDKAPGAE
jgi:two-component system, cell cycle sensor histidine kinase and response regulator CckA